MGKPHTVQEVRQKMEHYCAYQERCHEEVMRKMREMAVLPNDADEIMVHLIGQNFLNEERFACNFARGKHRIKHWGKSRIINELKFRNISQYNIATALKEISHEEYVTNFHQLAERHWDTMTEKNSLKKQKKFCDFLLRKGFESHLVYEKFKALESS